MTFDWKFYTGVSFYLTPRQWERMKHCIFRWQRVQEVGR